MYETTLIVQLDFQFFWRGPRCVALAENRLGRPGKVNLQKFTFPLPKPSRVAVIEGKFQKDRHLREFAIDDIEWLQAYAPEALVMPLDTALWMADQKQRGLVHLRLTGAIVVLTSLADSLLAEHHRDLLWHAFGVPVFEQLRGWDGTVIAKECEVHDGLHIDETAAGLQLQRGELLVKGVSTGLTGEMVTGLCECGAETTRLRSLAPLDSKAALTSI
jgi:hypothetical protein